MRICLANSFLLLVFVFGFNTSRLFATHGGAIEMFYRWTQDSTYEFTLIYYRTCQGSIAPPPVTTAILASAPSVNQSPASFNCTLLSLAGPNVPPINPPNMLNCSDSFIVCWEEYVYRGSWTSPKRANDWIFTFSMCCSPVTIAPTNVTNNTLWIECGLNNLDFPDAVHKNNSPVFHNRRPNHPGHLTDTVINYPWVSVCEGRPVYLNEGVRNYDQDVIRYELYTPQTTNGASHTYINGYSFSNPMPTKNGLILDSITGGLSYIPGIPTYTGVYLLGIKATEYRNDTVWVLGVPTVTKKEIGFVKRNLYILINDSATCPDTLFQFKDTVSSGTVSQFNLTCNDNPFRVKFKPYVLCNSIDSNGSHILLINASTLDTVNVVKSYSNDCSAHNTTNGFLIFLDSALAPGNYYLMLRQGDDGNTLMTECYRELAPLADTLVINVTTEKPVGVLVGDTLTGRADTIELECYAKDIGVFLTEEFKCNSVATDASDFRLYNLSNAPPTLVQLNSAHAPDTCVGGLRTQVHLTTKNELKPGYYVLTLVHGTDGNSLLTYCRENFDTSSIVIKVNDIFLDLGPDITYCKNSNWDTVLTVPSWAGYWWNTGSFDDSIYINTSGTYWLKVFSTCRL